MHYRPKATVRKKQQQLLRPTKIVHKNPSKEETSRVRTLNRNVSEVVSSMHHVQTRPAQAHTQCGKSGASNMYVSDSVKDDTQYIQAVTLHPHQFNGLQKNARSKESLLRNNYGKETINHELSSALHSTGAQYQMQSQVMGTSKSNEARGPVNGQQPQPVQTVPPLDTCKGEKRDTPPHGNYRSLTRRVGEALKRRNHSHTIGRHAQWAGQYNGVRYLLQYVHWQTVRPQLTPINEWEERMMNERLTQIAQSVEHETLNPRVVGSSLHEKLQKLHMIAGLSLNDSPESLECHDWSAIRRTSTPCSQPGGSIVERNATVSMENGEHCGHPRSQQTTNAFPETAGKFIPDFQEHSPKARSPSTPVKGMRAPKYNYAQRMRKFTGCMQGKRKLSVE